MTGLPTTRTVLGREYVLHDPEESPPRWVHGAYGTGEHVTLWGYGDMWRACTQGVAGDATVSITATGATPEEAVLGLARALDDIAAAATRLAALVGRVIGGAP